VLTQGELTAFNQAIVTVNGNPYYGFNTDIGNARSTKFSSLGYVSKELLIALNGETSLRGYKGWIKQPKNSAIIKSMIDEYIKGYVDRIEEEDAPDVDKEIFEQIVTRLEDQANNQLFQ
jgi:hypothetical protein